MTPIVVYGAGGLGREVEWLIRRINHVSPRFDFVGFVVTDRSKLGLNHSTERVIGDEDWLLQRDDMAIALGIGTPAARLAIGDRLRARLSDDHFPALYDPSAIADEDSLTMEPGSVITAGCVLTVGCVMERFSYLNLDCTVGHEGVIGPGSVLNPSVNVSGGVTIGEGVLVGTGAQILQYIQIGDGATVGAGAVVTRDVPAGQTVVGVPARSKG
ncbi:MAG: transferase [Myxococcota bacterium]|jgi:sugar O-acyltransferase (sialic acid O-acetyltransferase NeuD family)|nr:transferase [Myxococcota bacterium]